MQETISRPYDRIADFYDADMGQNMPFDDVGYYVSCALERPQAILEMGCGTGRITVPLLVAGLNVTAIDNSAPMIAQLRRKLHPMDTSRLQLLLMDIRQWGLRQCFSTILCPYSLFTYLLCPREQSDFLREVRQHLSPNGQFVLDLFIPNSKIQHGEMILDYRRKLPDGNLLERWKRIEPVQDACRVNVIQRRYRLLHAAGRELRQVVTNEMIRYFYPEEIPVLLREHGFSVLGAGLDYGATRSISDARFITFKCRIS